MAIRNRSFRIAATLAAGSYLFLAARYLIEAFHLFEVGIPAGYGIASVISVAARLLGATGWVAVATAFGPEIDWRRLRRGATIVVQAYVATFAAAVFDLLPTLARYHHSALRGLYGWTAVGALLSAVGAVVAVSGFADSHEGASRANRLRLGMILASGSAVAATVAEFSQHSYFTEQGYVDALTTGVLVTAIAQLGIALATLAVALRVSSPPARREARLVAAATGAAAATLGAAAGEVMIAVGYGSHGAPTWEDFGV